MTKKKFKSQAAFENHQNSKKYKTELAKFNQEKKKKAADETNTTTTDQDITEQKKTPAQPPVTTDKD